jgi:hypothetical protein
MSRQIFVAWSLLSVIVAALALPGCSPKTQEYVPGEPGAPSGSTAPDADGSEQTDDEAASAVESATEPEAVGEQETPPEAEMATEPQEGPELLPAGGSESAAEEDAGAETKPTPKKQPAADDQAGPGDWAGHDSREWGRSRRGPY